jgi:uncharacterized membrane protein YccF (DUF307 family)
MTTARTSPQVTVQTRRSNPGCLLSALWFIFFGWWIGGLATLAAWFLNITIIGLPLGLFILNNLPFLLVLQPPSTELVTTMTPAGAVVREQETTQINWFLRAIYFLVIGWWWSLVWMLLSYVVCITIIGLPLGLLMFRLVPATTTLKRY